MRRRTSSPPQPTLRATRCPSVERMSHAPQVTNVERSTVEIHASKRRTTSTHIRRYNTKAASRVGVENGRGHAESEPNFRGGRADESARLEGHSHLKLITLDNLIRLLNKLMHIQCTTHIAPRQPNNRITSNIWTIWKPVSHFLRCRFRNLGLDCTEVYTKGQKSLITILQLQGFRSSQNSKF